jgi:hypothetical protein
MIPFENRMFVPSNCATVQDHKWRKKLLGWPIADETLKHITRHIKSVADLGNPAVFFAVAVHRLCRCIREQVALPMHCTMRRVWSR